MGIPLLTTAFLQGLIGSTHCLGMCGPFVILLQSREGSGVLSNFIYNFGRTISYAIMGILLGFLGWGANRFLFADFASYVGGSIIIILGLGYIFPLFPKLFALSAPSFIKRWATDFLKNIQNIHLLSFLMGSVSGLLPCGLLFPAYGLSLLAGDPWMGAVVMVSFSLGTYPMLLTLGLSGQKFLTIFQKKPYRIFIGILLIVFALYTIFSRVYMNPDPEECQTEQSFYQDKLLSKEISLV